MTDHRRHRDWPMITLLISVWVLIFAFCALTAVLYFSVCGR
jgi:hypothetical protein